MKYLMRFLQRLKQQAFYIVFFAVAFAVIGYTVPRIYLQYFDKTIYYSLELPIKVDKKVYKPCEFLQASADRISLVNTMGTSIRELVLIKDDRKVFEKSVDIAIPKGQKKVSVTWQLPCDTEEGTYFWRGGIEYTVQGIYKYFIFYTEEFEVIK